MIKRLVAILILCAVTICNGGAQTINKARLDSLFHILNSNNKAMGSVAISENGKMLYRKAIGYSNATESGKKTATEKTKYRIGSISKMFTATLIFQLIEDKKLSLDTKLDKYFPQLPNAASITIGQLLSHRSGLHNFTNDSAYLGWNSQPKTHDEILSIIANHNPDFEPGSTARYSNSNFVVLGYIAEKIYGQPYKEILKKHITSRIGLKDTYYGGETDTKNDESYSYTFTGHWVKETETDMSIPGGAGAIVSTPTDLVKFIEALFDGKLVSKSSLAQMMTINDGYGMGMFQFPFGEKKAYGHTGGIDGFGSNVAYIPEDHLAIAYCGNGQVYPINDIMIGILSIYYKLPYSLPDFKTVSLSGADLDKFTGVYATDKFPLKITITKNDNVLVAQATGQSSFPLEAVSKNTFKFDQAGVIMVFNAEKKSLLLKQGGGTIEFTKE